ncbi:Ig-like domain-containing protein [Pseudolysinimonas sp.]|uniref:Ig-like domain-containing protein n=1 Tax=Pseudolysinimonas sp. TaxID=2680009 RepID=UPI003782D6F5
MRHLVPLVAGVASVAVVATLAVALDGYDAQEVPALSSSVWVSRDSGQYARVNTELAEIDTVRAADDPDTIVQDGDAGLVLTGGYGRAWPIDAANPGDLGAAAGDAEGAADVASGEATPNGTRLVIQTGGWVAYVTSTGRTYLGGLPVGDELPLPILVDPFRDVVVADGEEPPNFVASAVAVDENGLVAMYSPAEAAVRVYDAPRDEFRDPVAIPSAPDADARVELTLVQGAWALFDPAEGMLWRPGGSAPIDTGLGPDARLQASSAISPTVHLADADGLFAIDPSSDEVRRLTDGGGVPAQPTVVAGELVAAWLSASSGRLWTERDGDTDLAIDGDLLEDLDEIIPVVRSNGDRAVLNETVSGMLWRVPDGQLIPVAQWSLDDENDRDDGTIQVDDVAEQEPPVAVADAFGVRPGELVALPLLLNDHDPNKKDVLTIVPESVTSIGDFGTLSLAGNDQQAVVRVAAGGGSTTFSYAVTDGVSTSPPASVTLTVVDPAVNTAPEWCGVSACVQEWPSPGISAGGTVTVPVLSAWVDHEGDVIVLADATKDDPSAPVTVVATADGDVVVRHQDPNASDAVIPITVTVADARGASATRTLEVRVTANPALVAEPIAVVAGVDEKVSVDVTTHVRGGSGSFSIVDAVQTSSAGDLIVVPNAASGRIDLTADVPGNYVVTYTVQDLSTQAQQSSLLRVTVVASGAPLSIAPMTAFVRANEDATVDVLAAVQNTSGRVLLVSEAVSSDPALGVSVVGQSRVRVAGTTPDGLPGRVGTADVTVTDGAGSTVQGSITVFLVAASTSSGPIAVPDTATVRAGSQADLLVLANDVSPRGERVVVHPDLEGSGTAGELAFVAGDRLRYLAPDVPGVYTLRYSIFLENSPQLLDSATVTVTVLPPGTNRDPQPPILTARVVAGQSVAIPFSGSGIDPDGDRVVLSDVSQPPSGQGIAEISAEGDALVYTAPGNGVAGGQVSFAYRVRDTAGAVAEGIVRVGVLATDISDVAPVTYGDYVRVQAGTESPLTVAPLLNDRDPLQGRLELESVVPNAPSGSPEYLRLDALLGTGDLTAGEVTVGAGDVLGVHSYVYTAVSQTSFSTAQGLIVVNVTDAPSPDAPVVTDTVVTAQNRGQLSGGVDVVTGKVQWASGDPAELELAIWGPAASRYAVDGRRISGPLPADGDIVPFSLTGPTPAGATVVSYGFLRIPAFDDMRIQLKPGTEPLSVPEEQSVEVAVRGLLDLASADTVEIRDDDEFAVQRANATCTPASGSRVTYGAGREAPWSDTCTVPVRIAGQDTWTLLGVPVLIEPKDPQAILNSISRTIAPGDPAQVSIDLYDEMTAWEGGREGDLSLLDYQIAFSGTAFLVTPGPGDTVLIDVRADARPGTRESVRVSVDAYGGLTAGISLVVGIAPPDAPRGANFTQQCDVSRGATCAIPVVGKAGEYDPFRGEVGSGLKLVGVGTSPAGGTVSCTVATVRVGDDRQVVATWPAGPKPLGGECQVTYTVADAQGRTGQGVLTIDVLGYPPRPSSVTTTAYSSTSVTLRVDLGDARTAHPVVETVAIYEGGSATDAACTPAGPDYQCVISGLVNGDQNTYTARAVNSVGESLDTTGHTTSSYAKPQVTDLEAESVYRAGNVTTATTGIVSLSITAAQDAQAYRVLVNGAPHSTITRTGTTTTADIGFAPGNRLIEVIPISRFSPPIPGSNEGDAMSITGLAVGLPIANASGTAASNSDGTALILTGADADPNSSPDAASVTYYAWQGGTPSCTADANGDQQVSGAAATSATTTIGGLTPNEDYFVAACISYGFGAVATGAVATFTFAAPPAPADADTLTYSIDTSSSTGSDTRYYGLAGVEQATNNPGNGFQQRYRVNGGGLQNSLSDLPSGATPSVTVAFCKNIGGAPRCGPESTISPAAGGPTTTITVTYPECDALTSGSDVANASLVVASGPAAGQFTATASDAPGGFLGLQRVYSFDVTWTGAGFTGLAPAPFQRTCGD